MKKIIKILNIILIVIMFSIIISNISLASSAIGLYNGTNPGTDGKTEIQKIINTAISVVQVVGIFVAIVMLIFLGIKYMVASPGDRAEIKKHATVYVIGAVVMFGAAGILQLIKDVALKVTE